MKEGVSKRVIAVSRRWGTRLILIVLSAWLMGLVIFAFLPVPFSNVMVERQISAWWAGNFAYVAHQDWVAMDEIASPMMLAVIAAEDQKFPQHWGFDMDAIVSAVHHNERSDSIRGASTISQQTAKNLFLWDGRSWIRKGLEAGLTLGMEIVWTKRRILTVYLNVAEFGPGVFGVEAAAQRYFNRSARHLTRAQAAMLAAVLPNPMQYQVKNPSGYVLRRQQWVLKQMNQLGGDIFLRKNGLLKEPI